MYGTYRRSMLKLIRRSCMARKPERREVQNRIIPIIAKLLAWQEKAALMSISAANGTRSVSAANGARAAVVLVVEDEFLIRSDIAEHLREAGYTVVETASAA